MNKCKSIFEKCKIDWWPGYYISVKDKYTLKTRKRHITSKQKELYEKQFGNTLIYNDAFDEWLIKNSK